MRFLPRAPCPRLAPFVFAAVVAVSGCAQPETRPPEFGAEVLEAEEAYQRKLALRSFLKTDERLQRISWPILRDNVALCGEKTARRLPLVVASRTSLGEKNIPAWEDRFGEGEGATVVQVLEAESGLAVGDRILAAYAAGSADESDEDEGEGEGEGDADAGGDATEQSSITPRALAALAREHETLTLEVAGEAGDVRSIEAATYAACDYPVVLVLDETVNAYADGKQIVIHRGLLRGMQEDVHVALVVGHELAHNTRGHIDAKKINILTGVIIGVLVGVAVDNRDVGEVGAAIGAGIGAQAHSKAFEHEADYIGLYHTARAGYDISEAAEVWRWFGATFPGAIGIRSGGSHPSSVERYLSIDQTAAEILAKQASGEALIPNAGREDDADN